MIKWRFQQRTKYPNLKFLISERDIPQKQIAESIGIAPRTFCHKLQGVHPFTLDEAFYYTEYLLSRNKVRRIYFQLLQIILYID